MDSRQGLGRAQFACTIFVPSPQHFFFLSLQSFQYPVPKLCPIKPLVDRTGASVRANFVT